MLSEVQSQTEGVTFLRKVVDRHLSSPLLLVGDEGIGRRFSVIQATKEIFCTGSKEPGCGCIDCTQIDQGVHPDLVIITAPDDKEIGVADARSVVERAPTFPVMAPVRVFLIDGVDRMTMQAANALLKTLEEPPPIALFFLLAESAASVIPTVKSRCGTVRYRRLPEALVLAKVKQFEQDATKALVYARMAEGSVGRAIRFWGSGRLRLRDRVLAALGAGLGGDLPSLFAIIDEFGAELTLALRFLEHLLHDLLMAPYDSSLLINLDVAGELNTLRGRAKPTTWSNLRSELRLVQDRDRMTHINLGFHVKTALSRALLGG